MAYKLAMVYKDGLTLAYIHTHTHSILFQCHMCLCPHVGIKNIPYVLGLLLFSSLHVTFTKRFERYHKYRPINNGLN